MPLIVLQILAASAATVTITTGLIKLFQYVQKTRREAKAARISAQVSVIAPPSSPPVPLADATRTIDQIELPVSSRRPLNNVPAPLNGMVGRQEESGQIRELLTGKSQRLVTLTGPGGVGKTRLAIEVAQDLVEHFPDGVVFVSLDHCTGDKMVLTCIANALGVTESSESSLLDDIKTFLKDKDLLLVLDNFENVTDSAPELAEILTSCANVSALVTSRAVLHIRGEYRMLIQPLPAPDAHRELSPAEIGAAPAVQLFVQRAAEASPGFALTPENASTVAEITRRLEGLPLALELAAARAKLLQPAALLERLDSRLKLLTGGSPEVSRQQTMRDAIAWSYELLNDNEQALFRRLAVFIGGFRLEAAEAIGVGTGDVLESITSLVDESLLRQQAHGRLAFMETIREYAMERLIEHDEASSVRWQHADYYLESLRIVSPQLRLRGQAEATFALMEDLDNLRAAFDWYLGNSEHESALELAGLLRWLWIFHGAAGEGMRMTTRALQASPRSQTRNRAIALLAQGEYAWSLGDHSLARKSLEESVRILRRLDDASALGEALGYLGNTLLNSEDPELSEKLLEESKALAMAHQDEWGVLHSEMGLGIRAMARGDYAGAGPHFENVHRLAVEQGDSWSAGYALNHLGDVYRCLGDYARAEELYNQSLDSFQTCSLDGVYQSLSHNLGYTALRTGRPELALSRFRQSLKTHKDLNDPRGIAESIIGVAGVQANLGDWRASATLFGAAQSIFEGANASLWPSNRPDYARSLSEARRASQEAGFYEAWNGGAGLDQESAIKLAMNWGPGQTSLPHATGPVIEQQPVLAGAR